MHSYHRVRHFFGELDGDHGNNRPKHRQYTACGGYTRYIGGLYYQLYRLQAAVEILVYLHADRAYFAAVAVRAVAANRNRRRSGVVKIGKIYDAAVGCAEIRLYHHACNAYLKARRQDKLNKAPAFGVRTRAVPRGAYHVSGRRGKRSGVPVYLHLYAVYGRTFVEVSCGGTGLRSRCRICRVEFHHAGSPPKTFSYPVRQGNAAGGDPGRLFAAVPRNDSDGFWAAFGLGL